MAVPDRAWAGAAVLAGVVGTAGALATLPTPDVTWLLHVAGVLLDGGRLGVDVVENSPPVILWLELPAVLLARAAGWDAWLVWVGLVSLLAASSVWTAGRLLRRVPSLSAWAGPLQVVVALGLFLLPRQEFGQREHVTACLALPWLLAVAALAEGARAPRRGAWAVSLAGGIGLAIKPHFGLAWLAVAGVLAWRARSSRPLLRPELAAPVLIAVLAGATTVSVHPDWLPYALRYGPLYARYEAGNPLWVGLVGEGAEWSWLGLLSLLAFAPVAPARAGALPVLAGGLVGFHLAAALQMKGWPYHFLPAGMLGLLLAAAAGMTAAWRQDLLVGRAYRVGVVVGLLAVAWSGLRRLVELVAVPDAKWAEADPSLPGLLAEVRRSGGAETLLVLSTNIGSGWPLAHLAGAKWTLRHPSLWILAAIYRDDLERPGLVRTRPPAAWTKEERRMVAELAEDVVRRPPTVVALPVATPDAASWDVARRFRYEAILPSGTTSDLARCAAGGARSEGAYRVWHCPRTSATLRQEVVR